MHQTEIHSYYEYGFDTIKIKVGISFDEEYLLLQKIFNEFGDKLKISIRCKWQLEFGASFGIFEEFRSI